MQKNLYIIREDIINEIFNTEDEKLDIATSGDGDTRKSVIETISIWVTKKNQK